jgi:hypothetical protein
MNVLKIRVHTGLICVMMCSCGLLLLLSDTIESTWCFFCTKQVSVLYLLTASTRFTSSSSHQIVGELVLYYYLLVAKQLSLIRFSRKRIIRTATNIKKQIRNKKNIKRKTKNITLPEQLQNVIDKSHKLRIP